MFVKYLNVIAFDLKLYYSHLSFSCFVPKLVDYNMNYGKKLICQCSLKLLYNRALNSEDYILYKSPAKDFKLR